MAAERSPNQWCAACLVCRWWTGWVCRQEAVGFRACAAYGKQFLLHAVVREQATGRAWYVALKKGQTVEDLARDLADKGVAQAPKFEGGWDVFAS